MSAPKFGSAQPTSELEAVVSHEPDSSAADWNRLTQGSGNPFMTHEWLTCWWNAYGRGTPTWVLVRGEDGSVRAGAFLERRGRSLHAAANVHSAEWDVVGDSEQARARMWQKVSELGADRICLRSVPSDRGSAPLAREHLARGGYRIALQQGLHSPWLELPSASEQLLGTVSRGLRSQLGRRQRALERAGALELRVVTDGPTLDRDLEAFLKLEASGWKGRAGTAILGSPHTERLYREFARAAAAQGWMRLYMLELDGQLIAADYGCALAGSGSLIKTAFSESHGHLSPGLVLRAAVLRSTIEEGLHRYYFFGEADQYKRRWTSQVRPHADIWAFRGWFLPGYVYRRRARPALKTARDGARKALAGLPRTRLSSHQL